MLITKIKNRLLARVLGFPPLRDRSDRLYKADLAAHAGLLPPLDPVASRLVAEVHANGAVVTSLEELAGPGAPTILHAAQEAAKASFTAAVNKIGFVAHAPTHEMARVPEIYRWGLEKPLTIVEHALGLPVAYHGVYLRRDLANNVVRNSRLWHRDTEDRRMIKIIVYLKDVDAENGAFQFLPRSLSARIAQNLGDGRGFYSDEQICRAASPEVLEQIRTCTGPAGTVIIVDVAGAYHRGKRPEREDRLALFYDYTSRKPLHPFYCKPAFTSEQERAMTAALSQAQRDCVFWRPEGSRPPADLF
jgi:hypothetical protein